ncbi:MAG: ACP phosphodiesterase [Bacteroidota bacterium]|nr:ACP phosphodiesterase [Bacteroidota bacterium]
MNFLAHAYLSGTDRNILLGNFIGDFIKGRQALSRFDPAIIRGVELHRAIDEFTDSHPIVHESKGRLRATYRHYAGVIVDVFYDHFLAINWAHYHRESLGQFVEETYRSVESFSPILPTRFKHMFPYMRSGNWLVSYREIAGVHRALSGMASRTPYVSKMEEASNDLRKYYDEFNLEFQSFFPQLRVFCADWLSDESES